MIATSKIDKIDYLYEIKYWPSPLSISSWVRTLERVESAGISYETMMQRNFRIILMIVTSNEYYETFQEFYNAHPMKRFGFVDIKIFTEKDLQ